MGSTTANLASEQAVSDTCGGGQAHRFSFNLPSLAKGLVVKAHGIDVDSQGNPQLWNSPLQYVVPPETIAVPASESACTRQDLPDRNFSTPSLIYLRDWLGWGANGYLKFSVSVPGQILSAHLKVRAYSAGYALNVYRMTNSSWSQNNITWNNADNTVDASVLNNFVGTNAWVTIDVTSLLNTNGVHSLGLTQWTDVYRYMYGPSSSYPPVLEITYQR